jgi:hypothetical protein
MGDLDVDMEPSYGTNLSANSQSIPRQVCQGLKGLDLHEETHENYGRQC